MVGSLVGGLRHHVVVVLVNQAVYQGIAVSVGLSKEHNFLPMKSVLGGGIGMVIFKCEQRLFCGFSEVFVAIIHGEIGNFFLLVVGQPPELDIEQISLKQGIVRGLIASKQQNAYGCKSDEASCTF